MRITSAKIEQQIKKDTRKKKDVMKAAVLELLNAHSIPDEKLRVFVIILLEINWT